MACFTSLYTLYPLLRIRSGPLTNHHLTSSRHRFPVGSLISLISTPAALKRDRLGLFSPRCPPFRLSSSASSAPSPPPLPPPCPPLRPRPRASSTTTPSWSSPSLTAPTARPPRASCRASMRMLPCWSWTRLVSYTLLFSCFLFFSLLFPLGAG